MGVTTAIPTNRGAVRPRAGGGGRSLCRTQLGQVLENARPPIRRRRRVVWLFSGAEMSQGPAVSLCSEFALDKYSSPPMSRPASRLRQQWEGMGL